MRVGSELPDSQWTCVAVAEMLRAQAEREMTWYTGAPSAILTTALCARWFIGSKFTARYHPSCVDVSLCRTAAIVPECAALGMHTFWLRSSKVKVLLLCMLDEAKTPSVRLWFLRGAQICCLCKALGGQAFPPRAKLALGGVVWMYMHDGLPLWVDAVCSWLPSRMLVCTKCCRGWTHPIFFLVADNFGAGA